MILVQNIYYMLAYAFKVLQEQGYADCGTEDFENTTDLLSAILVKGVSIQIKQGLVRSYVEHTAPLYSVSGKIDVTASLKHQTLMRKQLVCTYDEFSTSTQMNRILKTTMELLLKADLPTKRKKDLRNLLLFFKDVESLDISTIDWHFNYNHNNQSYQMLMAICKMVIQGLLQTETSGSSHLMSFLDDQRMCRLFERFVLEFYRKHYPQIEATASQINWAVDDGYRLMLPTMQTDIMLSFDGRTLIIDAKFYSSVVQKHFESTTLYSNNLYQIFTYVKNKAVDGGNVSGLLLYALTDEGIVLDQSYKMTGNIIRVKTIDLNRDFKDISAQLEDIVREHFGVERER